MLAGGGERGERGREREREGGGRGREREGEREREGKKEGKREEERVEREKEREGERLKQMTTETRSSWQGLTHNVDAGLSQSPVLLVKVLAFQFQNLQL